MPHYLGHNDRRYYKLALRSAIEKGNVDRCQYLVGKGIDLNTRLEPCSCTPVLFALIHGQWDIALLLVEKGVSARGTTCRDGFSPEWSAPEICVANGKLDLFKQILKKEPDLADQPSILPLPHIAAFYNRTDFLDVLFAGFDDALKPTPVDIYMEDCLSPSMVACWKTDYFSKGTTALHIACHVGHLRVITLLLERGANINSTNIDGYLPLHYAASRGHQDIVKYLISKGANVNAQDWLMRTPARGATNLGDYESFMILAESGADLELCDTEGIRPTHEAASRGHLQILADLWSRGHSLICLDSRGRDVIICGFSSNHSATQTFLLNCGVDISCCSPFSGNILHRVMLLNTSCMRLMKKIARKLGIHRTREFINYKPAHWVTLLYLAVPTNEIPLLRFLLDAGADVNADGGPEGSALMAAARAGRLEAVRLLVDAGASVTFQRKDGLVSAVELAKYHPKVVRWFLVDRFTERRLLGPSSNV